MPKQIDETGHRHGKLTVIGIAEAQDKKGTFWECRCDCGNTVNARGKDLRAGYVTHCGCTTYNHFIDETGNVYGRLTVVSKNSESRSGHARWNCICSCGNTCVVDSSSLRKGHTRSCGCLYADTRKSAGMASSVHGEHSFYNQWNETDRGKRLERILWGGDDDDA